MIAPPETGPAYRIETERLVLRCWRPEDAPLLVAAITESLDHLRSWMDWAHLEPQTVRQKAMMMRARRADFDQDRAYIYGVFDRAERAVLGGTGLHAGESPRCLEIGYWVHVDHIGRGLATEIAASMTKVAMELYRIPRLEIHCGPANVRSAAIPRKLGYLHECTRRRHLPLHDGTFRDTMIWTLLADEYAGSPAAEAPVAAYDLLGERLL